MQFTAEEREAEDCRVILHLKKKMKTGSLQVPKHQHIKEDLKMENIVLNNKLECPVVGIGTFMLSPADAEVSVREAHPYFT